MDINIVGMKFVEVSEFDKILVFCAESMMLRRNNHFCDIIELEKTIYKELQKTDTIYAFYGPVTICNKTRKTLRFFADKFPKSVEITVKKSNGKRKIVIIKNVDFFKQFYEKFGRPNKICQTQIKE